MIRFLVFSDLHYDDTEDGDNRIGELLQSVRNRELDFVVSLGDLCKPSVKNKTVLEIFQSLGVPFYPVIGNHETDTSSLEDVTAFYALEKPYYSVLCKEYKLIFLNTCYLLENGRETAFYKRNFKQPCSVYPILPSGELQWLQEELQDGRQCIIFSHHSLANTFAKRGVSNRSDVWALLRNKAVQLCLNGHDHGDDWSCVHGIPCMTVNSANYAWLGAQIASSEILMERYAYLHGMLQYQQAMSAYIEIDNEEIRIFGMESAYRAVTPDDVGLSDYRWNGVSIRPRISSHRIQL